MLSIIMVTCKKILPILTLLLVSQAMFLGFSASPPILVVDHTVWNNTKMVTMQWYCKMVTNNCTLPIWIPLYPSWATKSFFQNIPACVAVSPCLSPCLAQTLNGYSISDLNSNTTQSVSKVINWTPINWSTSYTATVTCTNGTDSISNELWTISCNAWYHNEAWNCVSNTQTVSCTQVWAPANSTYSVVNIVITWDGSSRPIPSSCAWSCNVWYHNEAGNCISDTQSVSCIQAWAPANSSYIVTNSIITWDGSSRPTAPNCDFSCNAWYTVYWNTCSLVCQAVTIDGYDLTIRAIWETYPAYKFPIILYGSQYAYQSFDCNSSQQWVKTGPETYSTLCNHWYYMVGSQCVTVGTWYYSITNWNNNIRWVCDENYNWWWSATYVNPWQRVGECAWSPVHCMRYTAAWAIPWNPNQCWWGVQFLWWTVTTFSGCVALSQNYCN